MEEDGASRTGCKAWESAESLSGITAEALRMRLGPESSYSASAKEGEGWERDQRAKSRITRKTGPVNVLNIYMTPNKTLLIKIWSFCVQ